MAEDSKGNLWVSDTGNNRIEEFNEKNEYASQFGVEGSGAGQLKEPAGIAISAAGAIFIADSANNRVDSFNKKGEFVRAFGYGVINGEEKLEICKGTCEAGRAGSGNGQLHTPRGIAVTASGDVWVVDAANNRIEEFAENGEYITKIGATGKGPGQFEGPTGIAIDETGDIWVSDAVLDRIQEFSPTGSYLTTVGVKGSSNGQFQEPLGMSMTTTDTVYIADAKNNRVQELAPAPRPGNEGAHDTRTTYYTAKGESEVEECRTHPEWAGLPCQTEPVAQPGDGLAVPVTTTTYNMWDEPETTTEHFGTTYKRTKKLTYDAAGRPLTSEVAGNTDTTVPTVTNKYNSSTGALETQSTENGKATETIKSEYNTLGQLTSYTDAGEKTTTYEYEPEGDTRLTGINEGKGNQHYEYSPVTGELTTLLDAGATKETGMGELKATYDAEGKMSTETYPYGTVAKYTYNTAGAATGIEYEKTEHCATKCPETWFADTTTPAIHGETLAQTSSLSKETYTYDNAGRLTQTQEEAPTGTNCKIRAYAYNEDSDRTSLSTDEPGSKGECTTESPLTETHSYDSADRLIDAGVTYEPLGDITKLPASDAGAKTELTTSYYVDGQVATQTQGTETVEYGYDPDGRTLETTTNGKKVVSHYAGPGEALAWTAEGTEWTREIPGIDGTLTATETNGGTPVLQLHDLQGDIVGTVRLNATETKLLTTYNSTEFGVPTTSSPPKYSWLGAAGIADTLPSGVTNQGGTSYAPLIARTLQTNGVAIPAAISTNTAYVNVNSSWLWENAGAASARQIEAGNAARRALEGSPPGTIPSPLGGSQLAEGVCNGPGACASSNISCKLNWLFGEEKEEPGILYLAGNMVCNRKMPFIRFQECEWVAKGNTFINLKCTKKGWGAPNTTEAGALIGHICIEGVHYKAWIWADASLGDFSDQATVRSEEWTCWGFYGDTEIELVELVT
jgi:YD repeat-containing protein